MVNIKELKIIIHQSGIPMTTISERSGINRGTLYNRLSGIGEFTASEIVGLSKALGLSSDKRDQIFLSN